MDLQAEKGKFVKRLERLNDLQVFKALNVMLDFALQKEKETNLMSVTSNEYNKELEQADKEISQSNFFTHEEAITMSKTWKKQKGLK